MIKSEIKKSNPDLIREEIHKLAVSKYNEMYPNNPIVEEEDADETPLDSETKSESNAPAPEQPKSDTITMTKAELEKFMQGLEAKITERIKNEIKSQQPATQLEPEEDDYDEQGTMFFAYSHQHICHGYKLKGKEILPPSGKIVFSHSAKYRKSILGSNEYRDVQLCSYTSHSKKETAFLRNDPQFGIKIFENINGGDSIDFMMGDYLQKNQIVVSGMSHHAVVQRANAMGIAVSANVDEVRRELVFKLSEQDMNMFKRRLSSTAASDTSITPEVASSFAQAPIR